MATVSMKLAVEKSRMIEWMSQVHLPRDPREIRSRSWLRVSSLLEPIVMVSPSCGSDIHPKLVQSGSPPFRYSHLQCLSGVWGVVGMTNTVPFSLWVQHWSSSFVTSSIQVSVQQPASSSTVNLDKPDSCLAALCARLWGVVSKINYDIHPKMLFQLFGRFGHWLLVCTVHDKIKQPNWHCSAFLYSNDPLLYTFPVNYLSLGLPLCPSLSPLFSTFLFGLLSPFIDNHFTNVEPTLKTKNKEKQNVICIF